MRHLKSGRKLGRTPTHRLALFKNMASQLFRHEKIYTTDVKAKELRKLVERLITWAKRGDLSARRYVERFIRDRKVIAKMFTDYAERFKDRHGGYVRITKVKNRLGDGALISLIELMPKEGETGSTAQTTPTTSEKQPAEK